MGTGTGDRRGMSRPLLCSVYFSCRHYCIYLLVGTLSTESMSQKWGDVSVGKALAM